MIECVRVIVKIGDRDSESAQYNHEGSAEQIAEAAASTARSLAQKLLVRPKPEPKPEKTPPPQVFAEDMDALVAEYTAIEGDKPAFSDWLKDRPAPEPEQPAPDLSGSVKAEDTTYNLQGAMDLCVQYGMPKNRAAKFCQEIKGAKKNEQRQWAIPAEALLPALDQYKRQQAQQ